MRVRGNQVCFLPQFEYRVVLCSEEGKKQVNDYIITKLTDPLSPLGESSDAGWSHLHLI